jgi:hypothetical protein
MKPIVLIIIGMLVGLLPAGIAGFAMGQRQSRRQAGVSAHHAEVRHCLKLGEEVKKRVNLAWRNRIRLEDFKEEFGPVEPVDRNKYPDAEQSSTHVYMHQDSYRVFYLSFENDVLTGYNSTFGVDDIRIHLPSIESRTK